jgi:uncharacterized glyoxalase superfamily protein PhnB
MTGTSPENASGTIYPVSQVNVVVEDLERTRDFYSVFGWEFSGTGDKAIRAKFGHLIVSFHLPDFVRTWDAGYQGGTGSTTVLDIGLPGKAELDRVYNLLVEKGCRTRQAPWETFWGMYYATIEDPDGHPVGLKSPLE